MNDVAPSTKRLTRFYGELSSLEAMMKALAAEGVDTAHLRPSDVYTRDLDCQNLGGFAMLACIAGMVGEYATLGSGERVVDVGCGLGGPGRFLVDRYGCAVTGIDLLPLRIAIAHAISEQVGWGTRIAYHVAEVTHMPFPDATFSQAWMLDVSIHVRDKTALCREIARVVQPDGLLVMHDQLGPLPQVMRVVTRRAPYIAPSFVHLVRDVEAAGLRVLAWRDTTLRVVDYFRRVLARRAQQPAATTHVARRRQERRAAAGNAYLEALTTHRGRTDILIARRRS